MFKARVSMLNPKFDVEIETPTYNETVKLLDAIVEKLKPESSSGGYSINPDTSVGDGYPTGYMHMQPEKDISDLKITKPEENEKLNSHLDL